MPFCQKLEELNEITEPFGFLFHYPENVFCTTQHAWQREFGYCRLFDELAPRFNIITESEPIYFDYDDRTWLLEVWKGQYGVTSGAEIGVYHTNRIIHELERSRTLFAAASDNELLDFSYCLYEKGDQLYSVTDWHWWLTGFIPGKYSCADKLHMAICITFPNECMTNAFLEGLLRAGYSKCEINTCCLSVSFCFSVPKTPQPKKVCGLSIWFAKCNTHFYCWLYWRVTRCFDTPLDQLTYLRLFLPRTFKRIVCMKKASRRYSKYRRGIRV